MPRILSLAFLALLSAFLARPSTAAPSETVEIVQHVVARRGDTVKLVEPAPLGAEVLVRNRVFGYAGRWGFENSHPSLGTSAGTYSGTFAIAVGHSLPTPNGGAYSEVLVAMAGGQNPLAPAVAPFDGTNDCAGASGYRSTIGFDTPIAGVDHLDVDWLFSIVDGDATEDHPDGSHVLNVSTAYLHGFSTPFPGHWAYIERHTGFVEFDLVYRLTL